MGKLGTRLSNIVDLEGVLLIDKPPHCTSHDVVSRVRKKLKMQRIGHAGTLDPLATGLLIILVGKATQISQHLMSLDKEYQGTCQFGEITDTQDSSGIVLAVRTVPDQLVREELQITANEFLGDQYQIPPMFSAKKINGVALYKLARKGQVVARTPRFIHISRFNICSYQTPLAEFIINCSKGTYIRTIVHDFGQKIGCGAHMTQLRRTATDLFNINQCTKLSEFEEMSLEVIKKRLIPICEAVPRRVL